MERAPFTIGVEEEYFLVDATTLELRPRSEVVLADARRDAGERVEPELHLAQVEASTPVCTSLAEVSEELGRLRATLMRAAVDHDSRLVALGTHPFSEWISQQITPKERYLGLDATYQQLAWEQLVCGCHVHVGINDPELAIAVMNHVRPHMGTLRALATNSPYWQGVDTGYASYRMTLFDRWPTAGAPPFLTERAHYDDIVAALVATETIDDASKLYWDVRPSLHYPTLEFRVADVFLTVGEAVMLAGLIRALVRIAVEAVDAGRPAPIPPAELVRAARWRAARYGLEGSLIDVGAARLRPARDVVGDLLGVVRDDLAEHDEWDLVAPVVERVLDAGSGTARQRRAMADEGLGGVVDLAVSETVPGS